MFDKLIDLILQIWRSLLPFRIVAQYERGVLLRFGKFKRELHPGLRWFWPFIDDLLVTSVVPTTEQTSSQSITARNGKSYVVSLTLTYYVCDVRKYLLELHDGSGAVLDCVAGVTYEAVRDWAGIDDSKNLERRILTKANRKAAQYGIKFTYVQFSDLAVARTYRLMSV